jgi:tetratricopeptide (TPR) repeat protein
MRTRFLVAAAALAIALPALALAPAVFAAGGSGGGASGAGTTATPTTDAAALAQRPHDPKNQTNISDYVQACVDGNAKYLSRDFDGAIALYRQAIQISTQNPLGYYLMGEAQLAKGSLPDAEAAWQQADRASDPRTSPDPILRSRILFLLADAKEREKKWDEAKTAWARYSAWGAQLADAGPGSGAPDGGWGVFPGSGTSRVQMIDAMLKQDKDYEKVRQAIRNSADGGLFSVPDGTPG